MPDTPGQAATGRDSAYSLTVEEAAALYAHAGHPRTLRTVQRYCATGHLECIKEATMLGDKYFVDPASVSRHLAQIEELIALDRRASRRDASRPAVAPVAPQIAGDSERQSLRTSETMPPPVAQAESASQSNNESPDGQRHGAPQSTPSSRPIATIDLDTSRYVAGLEREVERALEDRAFLRDQITTKDQQIAALLERDRETNILVRGLQQMLSPLLGPARRDPPEEGHQAHF